MTESSITRLRIEDVLAKYTSELRGRRADLENAKSRGDYRFASVLDRECDLLQEFVDDLEDCCDN